MTLELRFVSLARGALPRSKKKWSDPFYPSVLGFGCLRVRPFYSVYRNKSITKGSDHDTW